MFFQAQVYFFQFSVFFASEALRWVQIPQGRASWTFVWEWQAFFCFDVTQSLLDAY